MKQNPPVRCFTKAVLVVNAPAPRDTPRTVTALNASELDRNQKQEYANMSKSAHKHTGLSSANIAGKISEHSRQDLQEDGENSATDHAQTQKETTTRFCPKCKNSNLMLVRTMNYKFCTDCDLTIPWFLDEGQEPLA